MMLEQHGQPRFMIAGTHSGVGKTTVSVGLMGAFSKRSLIVQGYKAGPDFIDPSYHSAVTKRPARNLDGYMCTDRVVREIFLRGNQGANLAVIEGVMGLYDGKDPLSNAGSTAEIAKWLGTPVILCLDISSMARSAAAVVLGYQKFDPNIRIAGVIANRAGSEGHFRLVKAAVEQECNVPVLGYLPKLLELKMPERHLGLIPAIERGDMDNFFNQLADLVEATIDLDGILKIAQSSPPIKEPSQKIFQDWEPAGRVGENERVVIAIAKDAAFNFYYPENLELLESFGAQLQYFSPLAGENIPNNASGLYIGGGFPEEFASTLSQQNSVLEDFRFQIMERKLPTFAECGGYMFLCRTVITRDGQEYPMVGILSAAVTMQAKLAALGYREVTAERDTVLLAKGEKARGHEFHYSSLEFDEGAFFEEQYAYTTQAFGRQSHEGVAVDQLLAGYTHLHFASNPHVAERFVTKCREFSKAQEASI